ncbi:hypothetical protein GW17_00050158 [Ensete ventricosum]|nr:hypothetical protein GW17_00050158 [Ensete ventricosum]
MLLCHLASLPLVRLVPPLAAFPKTLSSSSSVFSSPISRSALRWGWHLNPERRGSRRPDRRIGGSQSHSMESKTEARDPAAESPAAVADGGKGVRLKLEEFNWDHSFVRELPGDPRSDTIPRQLKGAGKTPYSRFADGLAVLRSSIREFLCSEAMNGLGIPTTRALSLDEPGAIVCRVAQSFLRFGSYQIHASRGKEDLDLVRTLADYTIRHHFPHIEKMSKSDDLSFEVGVEGSLIVDLTSNKYGDKFMDEYQSIMTRKLGLSKYNKQLISTLLNNMAVDKVDYTNFFRLLSNIKADTSTPKNELLVPLKAALLDIGQERKEAWTTWVQTYIEELVASGTPDDLRKAAMNSVNPKYILRNYLCQSAIDAAEQGDYGEVRRLLKLMEHPYDDQPGMEKYARLPPAWAYRPGVCMLSCSS